MVKGCGSDAAALCGLIGPAIRSAIKVVTALERVVMKVATAAAHAMQAMGRNRATNATKVATASSAAAMA